MSGKPFVGVLGADREPLMSCTGKRARLLLERGRAKVVRVEPFVIQLTDRTQGDCELQDMTVKIDPGSKYTGICLARVPSSGVVVVTRLIELAHRGQRISMALTRRAALRRSRRQRNTRYRQARFLNRSRPKGWLPPSLMHRIQTTMTWVKRLCHWFPVTELAMERVKFDMQKMQSASIEGTEYQRGDLFEREVMEYLLVREGHRCIYCDTEHALFNKDHVIPRAKGGSNRISNLVLSCRICNEAKDNLDLAVFLAEKPTVLAKVLKHLKTPLRDAAAVNATRNRLLSELLKTGLPVETGTGAQTKWNRKALGIPKSHALDAGCTGVVTSVLNWVRPILTVKCEGRGTHVRTSSDKYGFPRLYASREKKAFGFQTGDLAKVTRSKVNQQCIGRITIRHSGSFTLTANNDSIITSWRTCRLLQHADGYGYKHKYLT